MSDKKECIEIRKEIQAQFDEQGVKLLAKDIDAKLKNLVVKFKVPLDEAKRTVIISLNKEHGIKVTTGGDSQDAAINDLVDEQWCNVDVRVTQLWDSTSDSIGQVGLIADATGSVKFTAWASANAPDMEEGKSYKLSNVVINTYNGKLQVTLNKTSKVEPLDIDIEAGTTDVTLTGAIVALQKGSGYIKRCPECNKAISKGACKDHGKIVTGAVPDLRTMAILDDGIATTTIHIGRDLTEQITGTTLDECELLVADALDHAVVIEMFRSKLIGHYFTVTGPQFDTLLASEIEEITTVDTDATAELVAHAQEV